MSDIIKRICDKTYLNFADSRDISDDELMEYIDKELVCEFRKSATPLHKKESYRRRIYNSMKRLDILQELIEDDSITEIMINGYKDIFIERNGRLSKWGKSFSGKDKLEDIAQKIAAMSNRIVNASTPIVDTRLEDGSRVNIVLPPVAINGPVITIRKFYDTPLNMEKLIEMGSITKNAADFLLKAVRAKYNIFISGGTGSGKTTFLNALSNYIPKDERIITIEDSAELQIRNIDNLVRLEARNANIEGMNAISIRDMIKASLRMRPSRIIVGEVRGEEAIDMLQAMMTGHEGSLSTGHANNPEDMISRLETMVLMGMDIPLEAIKNQIASAIDIIVHLGRVRDSTRKVLSIVEVLDYKDGKIITNPIFEFVDRGTDDNNRVRGGLEQCECGLVHKEKMENAGY